MTTDAPTPDSPEPLDHDDDHGGVLRSYLALAFVAVLVVLAVWVVNSLRASNAALECMAAGHHDCVPLDTSVKGTPR